MPDETVLKLRLASEVEQIVDKLSDELVTYVQPVGPFSCGERKALRSSQVATIERGQ